MNTLILCNGQPPPEELFEEKRAWADMFIAADGGGNIARSFGAVPDYVIGDLDSYETRSDETVEIIHKPSQYANDLEKALELAKKKGGSKIKVLGATGLRLDHTLKNLSVLKQFNEQFERILFADAYGTIQLLPGEFTAEIPVGTTISLFPLSGKVTGIITRGLKYPLTNGFLENGVSDGSSNSVVSSPVAIIHEEGDLLLFIVK
jgi:thiamine pyrophosphokinase